MEITDIIKNNAHLVENRLKSLFEEKDSDYEVLLRAMEYSLLIGGKRIRPHFLLEFNSLCGGDKLSSLDFACAVEMIHTYSLIHDDLPCMDNDDLRRGKPSCHKAFSEDTALLAGDALLTHAFYVASGIKNVKPQNLLRSIGVMSKLSGYNGMIGGQQIDLLSEGKNIKPETLKKMYKLKTGALISLSAQIGCILADADEEQIKAADKYAQNVGLAFQIVDDILDITGDEKTLGKPIGSDSENLKSTYVSIYGIEKSEQKVKELTEEAISALNVFDGNTEILTETARYLTDRKN